MTGISQASGILAARDGLHAAIAAATSGMQLDRYYGMPDRVTSRGWVGLGGMSTDFDPRTVNQRGAGNETITIDVSLGVWVPGHTDATAQQAFAAAFDLLAVIQTYIMQHDIKLGGSVLWCIPGSVQSDGIEDEDGGGYVAELAAEFVCLHRVRPL